MESQNIASDVYRYMCVEIDAGTGPGVQALGLSAPGQLGGSASLASPLMPGSGVNMRLFQEFQAHFMDTGSGIKGDMFQSFLKDGNGNSSELTAPKCK